MLLWNYEYSAFGIAKKTIETEKEKSGLMLFITGLISLYMIGCIFGLSFFVFLFGISMVYVPFLMPYFIYIFASLLRVPSTIVQTNSATAAVASAAANNDAPDEGKGVSYFQNILSLIGVLIGLQSLGIGHLYGIGAYGSILPAVLYIAGYIIYNVKFVTSGEYSTTKILVSKIVPITIVLAIIIILYSGYYGATVMICVSIIFLAIWFTCNKHKILFYPYDPTENETFVKFSNDIQNVPTHKCSKQKDPKDNKGDIEKIIEILLAATKIATDAATAPGTAPSTATNNSFIQNPIGLKVTANNVKSKPKPLFGSPSIKLTTPVASPSTTSSSKPSNK